MVAKGDPVEVSERQADILLHTLGLDERHHAPYRDHYVAGDGHHAMDVIVSLVELGLMEERRAPGFLAEGDRVYGVTDAGRVVAAVARRRRFPPPSRAKSRYDKWLSLRDACTDLSFGDFLKQKLYDDEVRRRWFDGFSGPVDLGWYPQ